MRKLVKDSEGNVAELASPNGFIPEGWTEVAAEEIDAEEIALAKRKKMDSIRARRDAMLSVNDREWLISKKKAEVTTDIEADAQILRDLPEAAEADLDALESKEDIEAHDAFDGLALSRSYE